MTRGDSQRQDSSGFGPWQRNGRVMSALAGRRRRALATSGSRRENVFESMDGRAVRFWEPRPEPSALHRRSTGPWVQVPLTPLAARPTAVSRNEAYAMLRDALHDVPVDRADRAWLVRAEATWEAADLVILASLLARARHVE